LSGDATYDVCAAMLPLSPWPTRDVFRVQLKNEG
jgi:hypothetical protein